MIKGISALLGDDKKDVVKMQKKICIAAIAVLLLSGCSKSEGIHTADTDGAVNMESDADTKSGGMEDGADESIDAFETSEKKMPAYEVAEVVDYPFFYYMEDWSLVLCREDGDEEEADEQRLNTGGHRLKLYDGEGNLQQDFPCNIEAEKLMFRFDNLCDDHQFNYDLEVFPADAAESCADGLLFSWDEEGERFVEEPIVIPWYEEIEPGNLYSTMPFLVKREMDFSDIHEVYNTIYCINDKTREPEEMRIWSWTRSGVGSEDETLEMYIWDCLHEAVLYNGEVQADSDEELMNNEYYQDMFWKDLPRLWSYSADTSIHTTKYIVGEDDWELEDMEYESREALLADCGFQDAEPFYEYYDRFGNLELELYFDEDAGKGCGFYYWYKFNYELEEIVDCDGFIFGGLHELEWKDDTYSLLTYDDEDARKYAAFPDTLYRYNADEKLTAFEVTGYIEIEQDRELDYREWSILSMDWIYRDDGTLYRKYYHHEPRCFGTTSQSQQIDYDELGRQIYRSAYITHGECNYYYIYDGENTEPKYCLFTDWNLSSPLTEMFVYR